MAMESSDESEELNDYVPETVMQTTAEATSPAVTDRSVNLKAWGYTPGVKRRIGKFADIENDKRVYAKAKIKWDLDIDKIEKKITKLEDAMRFANDQ
jgi:hypothetical protein